jgi:hypothetical protein
MSIGMLVTTYVRRQAPSNEMDNMIIFFDKSKNFGDLNKYLGMIFNNSSEIQG